MVLCISFLVSCDSFIKKEDEPGIKEFEKDVYSLNEDIGNEDHSIKKGEKVKIFIVENDDFIKVYCYEAGSDFLKSERILILYLFNDDFPAKTFSIDLFKEKLFEKVRPIKK